MVHLTNQLKDAAKDSMLLSIESEASTARVSHSTRKKERNKIRQIR